MAKQSGKKPRGRPPTISRPVLQFRVQPAVYNSIKEKAAALNLTISEEAARRLDRYDEYEQAFGSAKKILADARTVIEQEKDAVLRSWGIVPVGGRPGHYVETAKISPSELIALSPELENFIERIVTRTLEKVKQ